MTIWKPKNSKHYHFDFQFKGQRFHGSTGCQSKRDAERYERDRRTEAALGTKVKPSITWDEACGLYWEQKGQFEKDRTVKGQLKRLVAGIGKSRLLGDLTFVDLNGYVARRRGEMGTNRKTLVSAATVNRELELARRVVRLAASAYSAPEIEWPKLMLREPKERVRELSATEEVALFEQLSPDLAAVVEFAMLSGQRRTAIITLLWSNVDFPNRRAKVLTKGGKWHEFPLTPRMVAILANRPQTAPQVFTYECERPAPPRNDRPGRQKGERYPFSKQGWTRKWRAALTRAGVTDFRFHDLRHTAGSRIARGSNIRVAQKLLGHTRIETTARYVHSHFEDVLAGMIASESRIIPEAGPVVAVKPLEKKAK